MTDKSQRVVVIGAGIIGAACAYYLCRAGWEVTVVEKDRWGQGSSHGNCGLIVPSHVLPLNQPGVLWQGLQWMLKSEAPLYIKPRVDLALGAWLLRFAWRCTRRAMLEAAAARSNMLKDAVSLYAQLIAQEAIDCEWDARGVLCVFRTQHEFEAYRDTESVIASFGESCQPLISSDLQAFEPALRNDVAGAYLYTKSAHLRPDLLMRGFKRVLTDAGVTILEHTTVSHFKGAAGRVQAAVTDKGVVSGDEFVVATGAWTPLLNKALGFRVPIQPGKGYSVTMPRPTPCPSIPCMLEEDRVVATPWAGGYRLGGTMEFSGYDNTLNQKRLAALHHGAERYFKPMALGPVEEEWCGWRPMTIDGLPFIDRSPRWQNVLLAAGHNMLGISLAPGTGKLVCEILNGAKPHLDPGPYGINRLKGVFKGGN